MEKFMAELATKPRLRAQYASTVAFAATVLSEGDWDQSKMCPCDLDNRLRWATKKNLDSTEPRPTFAEIYNTYEVDKHTDLLFDVWVYNQLKGIASPDGLFDELRDFIGELKLAIGLYINFDGSLEPCTGITATKKRGFCSLGFEDYLYAVLHCIFYASDYGKETLTPAAKALFDPFEPILRAASIVLDTPKRRPYHKELLTELWIGLRIIGSHGLKAYDKIADWARHPPRKHRRNGVSPFYTAFHLAFLDALARKVEVWQTVKN